MSTKDNGPPSMTKEEAIAVLENLIRRTEGTDLLSEDDKEAIRSGIKAIEPE